jgi:hypothetical protein
MAGSVRGGAVGRRQVVRTFLGAAVLPLFIAVAVNAATGAAFPGPLRLIQIYPWQSVLLGLVGAGVYAVWELRAKPSAAVDLTEAEQARLRRRLLRETRRVWVDGVLARSLGQVLRVELSLVSQQSRVSHPVQLLLRGQDADDEVLAVDSIPVDVFEQLGERLLVLGEPGAGKTTWLLELAGELCAIAEQRTAAQVPVVLSLSSWPAGDKVRFESWAAEQLRRFYDLSEPEARYAIEHGMAALLLDGLDEVPPGRLRHCVEALNAFRDQRGGTPVAVTCRVADYERYVQSRLRLVGAVLIQPLTQAQVDRWLASIGPAMDGLRSALRDDQTLRVLLSTPLTLNIAALTFRGEQVEAFTGLDSLFAAYTRRMLERPRAALGDSGTYAEPDVRRWLAALASGTVAAETAVISPRLATRFRAIWVNEAAVPWRRLPWLLLARGALPMAVLAGLTAAVLGQWLAAPVVAALTAAVAGIRAEAPNWFTGERSSVREELTRGEGSRRDRAGSMVMLALAGIGVVFGASLLRPIFTVPDVSVVTGIIAGAGVLIVGTTAIAVSGTLWVVGLAKAVSGLVEEVIPGRTRGRSQLAAAGVLLLAAGLAAGGAGAALAAALRTLVRYGIFGEELGGAWPLLGVLLAPAYAGVAGGLLLAAQYAVSDAYTPRLVYRHLARAGALPPRLGHFLAWADDRILLRKEGANYTFLHRLYRDWWIDHGT